MAKRTKRLQANAPPSLPSSEKGRIQLEPSDTASVFYVNYMEIGNTMHDFVLSGARIPGKFSAARIEEIKSTKVVTVDTEVQIVFPTSLLAGLIRALSTQKEVYERTIGVQLKEVGGENE
jgi:hypothetical protein